MITNSSTTQTVAAAQIVRLITDAFPTRPKTTDVFHAGDPDAAVSSVIVTLQATRDVLRQAVEMSANLVITHEPTFYMDRDASELAGDPVYEWKVNFIRENKLVIWRCHDAMHLPGNDMVLAGMTAALGWAEYQDFHTPELFNLPPVSLRQLAVELKTKLGISALRVTGDPSLPVRRVALSCGCRAWSQHRELLRHDGVDVLICGEGREWETCEYVRDSAGARPQGLITLGHRNSEEASMGMLADWLRPRTSGIPVYFVPAGDPFWYV